MPIRRSPSQPAARQAAWHSETYPDAASAALMTVKIGGLGLV
jgi:hypothetical protein